MASKRKQSNPKSKSKKPPKDECVIPPALPHDAIPGLMFKRDPEGAEEIRKYVEWQARGQVVTHLEKVTTEFALGRKLDAWDVHTDKERYWVITSPTNLYSQALFPSVDYTITFHVGLSARIMSRREPGVPALEEALLVAAWRRWEQAAETLDEADEAEEFQAIGMRCRESLVSMVKTISKPNMVPQGQEAPKRSDVIGWSELIADYLAHGSSAEFVRRYIKSCTKAGWQLANWLTHAGSATRADAEFTIIATQHILNVFGAALVRHQFGIPERCPKCGSYKIGLWRPAGATSDDEVVPACQVCHWRERPSNKPADNK